MRCKSEIFEKRWATIKNMKLFGSASALFVWLSVGAWAQTGPPPTDTNPAIKSGEITTIATPLPRRDQADAARPITLREAIDSALQQASNFKAARFNEQITAQNIKQAKAGALSAHRRKSGSDLHIAVVGKCDYTGRAASDFFSGRERDNGISARGGRGGRN